MQSDGTGLVRAMVRKLVEDSQQPHDQKISIDAWGQLMMPGRSGESGHQFEPFPVFIYRANYEYDVDSIHFKECSLDPKDPNFACSVSLF